MKLIPSALAGIAFSLFLFVGSAAKADNELIVYVFSNGAPVAGADVTVDGDVIGSTRSDGSVTGDLSSGGHAISVESLSGETGVVRFASNSGQLADVIFDLATGDTLVDVHSITESAADRRSAKLGTLAVRVVRDGMPEAGVIVNFSGDN